MENADPRIILDRLGQQGSTLIIAVWALFLLTVFAVQLGTIVRQKVTVVHRLDQRDKLFHIADAGIKYAITQLRKEDALLDVDFLSERWSDQESLFKQKRVGQGNFQISYIFHDGESSRTMYGLQDEERKINLNMANTQVLSRLLEHAAGLSHSDAEELAYCIIDWRDSDSFFQHPQYGAEDSDYKTEKFAYESKDSKYEVIEELLLVSGMNQEIYDKFKDFI
jgi:type II secretory pathway component PulK